MPVIVDVTGYGPFHGVDSNPTDALVTYLKECRSQLQTEAVELGDLEVLTVSVEDVAAFYDEQHHKCDVSPHAVRIHLHLGVHPGERFHVERTARNEIRTSARPDMRGISIESAPVKAIAPDQLQTQLDVEGIARLLSSEEEMTSPGSGPLAVISDDAGLDHCSQRVGRCHSLFLHVPHFSFVPFETQKKLLCKLIQSLHAFVPSSGLPVT